MDHELEEMSLLESKLRVGDAEALAALFDHHRDRLERLVQCSIVFAVVFAGTLIAATPPCRIPDTGQISCFNEKKAIYYPKAGKAYAGQDAQFVGPAMSYRDNGDGTVTDLVTGLMWSKGIELQKSSLTEAKAAAANLSLGGHLDWRVPTIKELYSLINFRGYTGFSRNRSSRGAPSNAIPFINTDYFDFAFGNTSAGERYIDAQWLTCTEYVSTTMGGAKTLFGVNFADGRIKGYGYSHPGRRRDGKKFYVRFVRGRKKGKQAYGMNDFTDNGNGTVTDRNTGLTWMKSDSKRGMTWKKALAYAKKCRVGGHRDWRLPNAKELQYIVDYSRSPDTTGSAAIDPIFHVTAIKNETGQKDYPYFWTSTTHLDGPTPSKNAAYISFGRAIGQMHGRVMDVHGAGAQRSDPKSGSPALGHGPQGDARRVYNFVRCVRGGRVSTRKSYPGEVKSGYPKDIRVIDTKGVVSASSTNRQSRQSGQGGLNRQGDQYRQGGQGQQSRQGGQSGRRGGFMNDHDRNGDGKVTKDEFRGPASHFSRFDTNGDGVISSDEVPSGPPPSR